MLFGLYKHLQWSLRFVCNDKQVGMKRDRLRLSTQTVPIYYTGCSRNLTGWLMQRRRAFHYQITPLSPARRTMAIHVCDWWPVHRKRKSILSAVLIYHHTWTASNLTHATRQPPTWRDIDDWVIGRWSAFWWIVPPEEFSSREDSLFVPNDFKGMFFCTSHNRVAWLLGVL